MATTFITHVQAGTHAARPGAGTVPEGTLYACSTHGLMYQSDGSSTWSDWFDPTDATSSFGSNVNAVGQANAGGSSNSNTRSDHVHLGVRSVAHASNTFSGPVILTASGVLGITSPTPGTFNLSAIDTTGGGSGSSGVDVQDEGTPLATTATTLNFVGAGVAATGSGATKTITIAGGSGGAPLLPFDVAPGSPHAKDDEFDAGSLDGKWTDPVTSTRVNAITFSEGWLLLEPATAGSGSIATTGAYGIRQAAPTGSFTISCKLVYDHLGVDVRAGLFTGRLTATATGHMLGVQDSTNTSSDAVGISGYSHTADWGTYDGFVDATTGGLGDRVPSWFKIVWDSGTSTFSFYYSKNGIFWTLQVTRASQQQPEYIGLGMWSNTSAFKANNRVAFDWFRVTEP